MKKHEQQEKCGYVRIVNSPKQAGEYLVKTSTGEYKIGYFDGKNWDEKNDKFICWTFFNKTKIDTPF